MMMVKFRSFTMSWVADDSKLKEGDVFDDEHNLLKRGISGPDDKQRWNDLENQ